MPILVKGGKYTFGWSVIGKDGKVVIPPEAMEYYNFKIGEKIILTNGSTRSGGFSIYKQEMIKDSPLKGVFKLIPELEHFKLKEGETVRCRNRTYCWNTIQDEGYIHLSDEELEEFQLALGDYLLSIGGIHLSLNFIVKGPIIIGAKKHNIKVFR
ncbi:MAG: hypothetical protein ACTSQE_06635 [Candidatus Heimdallarchaeaceae archaeon]